MMAWGQWLKLMETGDITGRGKPPALYGQLHLTVPFRYERVPELVPQLRKPIFFSGKPRRRIKSDIARDEGY